MSPEVSFTCRVGKSLCELENIKVLHQGKQKKPFQNRDYFINRVIAQVWVYLIVTLAHNKILRNE